MKKIIFLFIAFSSILTAQVTQQWTAVYNGPSGSIDSVRNLVVDNAGNVYVTGNSTSSNLLDYTTLKYNSDGVLQWEARYDGPNHFRDDAQWMVIDNSGNVYVTGSSRTGVLAGTEDFLTVKYNSNGTQLWTARYNGPGNSVDVAVKVVVDDNGNVYVTGYSYGNGIDYATVKYDSEGVQKWVARYNGPGNSLDAATALAVDGSGRVYVTGWSRSTSDYGSEDYLTINYDANGNEQWAVRQNGPANWFDAATSMALDNNGNILVTGHCYSTPTMSDYVTIKYNSAGLQQWIATYDNNTANGSDMAKMVITDNSGNVYVTGESNTEYPTGYPDYATVKYNSSGVQQWATRYNGPGNGTDVANSVALDLNGSVYVTGKITMAGFVTDFATVKYNSNGVQVWDKRFDGTRGLNDAATSVAVDPNGNVYVAGNSAYTANFASDYVIIKYNQDITNVIKTPSLSSESYKLDQNYPNPFNPVTVIRYSLASRSGSIENRFVTLKVYNALGKEVATLVNEKQNAGSYEVTFNGANFSSGLYYYTLSTQDYSETKKMILIR